MLCAALLRCLVLCSALLIDPRFDAVWSAVDDLEDIGRLEQYIDETQSVLIFLSKGCAHGLRSRAPCYYY